MYCSYVLLLKCSGVRWVFLSPLSKNTITYLSGILNICLSLSILSSTLVFKNVIFLDKEGNLNKEKQPRLLSFPLLSKIQYNLLKSFVSDFYSTPHCCSNTNSSSNTTSKSVTCLLPTCVRINFIHVQINVYHIFMYTFTE